MLLCWTFANARGQFGTVAPADGCGAGQLLQRRAAEYCGQVVNPVHLKTLLEVTRLGSFAAAAATLGYTASAVSQQMTALERDTGVVLFQRSARSVVPTEAAVVMTRHAAKVLTDIEALMAAASRTQDSANQELRLGIFPSLATYVLPRIL